MERKPPALVMAFSPSQGRAEWAGSPTKTTSALIAPWHPASTALSVGSRTTAAEADLKRKRQLVKERVVSQSDLDDAQSKYDSLVAQSISLTATIDRRIITAPFSGVLGFVNFLLYVYLLWYVYRSMRVVYGEGRIRTLLKYFTIGTLYLVLLAITMLAGLVYTMLGLS